MDDEAKAGSRWARYYANTRGRPPRETLLFALDRFEAEEPAPRRAARFAVDLGCGTGRDTIELLRRGWRVLAIDATREAIAGLRRRPDLPRRSRLETRVVRFEATSWPEADLVNASFALFLCPPTAFPVVWWRIVRSLRPGGRFAGQLLGDRDDWARDPAISCFAEAEADELLDGLEVEHFVEEEQESVTPGGRPKRWHIFHIVARKPPRPARARARPPEPESGRGRCRPTGARRRSDGRQGSRSMDDDLGPVRPRATASPSRAPASARRA